MKKNCPKEELTTTPTLSAPEILPERYGATRLVLLPVEPGKVHVYWEFVLRQTSSFETDIFYRPAAADEEQRTKTVLRFHEVTADDSGRHFDLEVDGYSGNRYVDVPRPGGTYAVEFGFRAATGHFFPAIRSDVVDTPAPAPAPKETKVEVTIQQAGPPLPEEVTPKVVFAQLPDATTNVMSEAILAESGSADFAVKSETVSSGAARNLKVISLSKRSTLAAISASANIRFLSTARDKGYSREAVRAEMDRLWRLTLLTDQDLSVPPQLRFIDLTELCEKRFLFGNSSK